LTPVSFALKHFPNLKTVWTDNGRAGKYRINLYTSIPRNGICNTHIQRCNKKFPITLKVKNICIKCAYSLSINEIEIILLLTSSKNEWRERERDRQTETEREKGRRGEEDHNYYHVLK